MPRKNPVGRPPRKKNAKELADEALRKKSGKEEVKREIRKQNPPKPVPKKEAPKVEVPVADGADEKTDVISSLHQKFPGVQFAASDDGQFVQFSYRGKKCSLAVDRLDRMTMGIREFIKQWQ